MLASGVFCQYGSIGTVLQQYFVDSRQNIKTLNTKKRFSRLCSKNDMNAGLMRVTGHYYPFTHESLRSA